ncbi:ecto-ADP-ribosyltransferase 5-like [Anomaloglossus baeobatrachus]
MSAEELEVEVGRIADGMEEQSRREIAWKKKMIMAIRKLRLSMQRGLPGGAAHTQLESSSAMATLLLEVSGPTPVWLNHIRLGIDPVQRNVFNRLKQIPRHVKMIRGFEVLLCVLHLFDFTQPLELDMMPDAFDDQYLCCEDKMEKLMPKILEEERKNKQFDETWKEATEIWDRDDLNLPGAFKDEYGVAVVLSNMEYPYPIYNQLNGNISIAGRSRDYYMQHFHFKALHFYLTRALQVLTRGCAKKYVAYRGSRQIYNVSSELRFGEFTASSPDKNIAADSEAKSFFNISTCFGVDIDYLSNYGAQDILIPVAEKFRNITKDGNSYTLESSGELCSYFNCAYLGGEKRKDPECNPGYGYCNEMLTATGTFLDCGSSSRLGLYGLILGVVIARLY